MMQCKTKSENLAHILGYQIWAVTARQGNRSISACVNLAYTRCMRTFESITPDHHVVLRNDELSQRCILGENTS